MQIKEEAAEEIRESIELPKQIFRNQTQKILVRPTSPLKIKISNNSNSPRDKRSVEREIKRTSPLR